MTAEDIRYFRFCYDLGLVQSPLLEIGSRKVSQETHTFRDIARELGAASSLGVDLEAGPGVDRCADFSLPSEVFAHHWGGERFQTVVIFNVLEHVFDPITVLANALHCVVPGGRLLVLAPSVWPIHNFPKDYSRLLPDWFEVFALKYELEIDRRTFSWVTEFGITPVDSVKDGDTYELPSFHRLAKGPRKLRSRIVHRLFNTFGRSHRFTYASIAATFTKARAQRSQA